MRNGELSQESRCTVSPLWIILPYRMNANVKKKLQVQDNGARRREVPSISQITSCGEVRNKNSSHFVNYFVSRSTHRGYTEYSFGFPLHGSPSLCHPQKISTIFKYAFCGKSWKLTWRFDTTLETEMRIYIMFIKLYRHSLCTDE